MKESLYDKYGGSKYITKIVGIFYEKLTNNVVLYSYFSSLDKLRFDKVIDHQILVFSSILGGPTRINRSLLKKVHEPLKIKRKHYHEFCTLFGDCLIKNGFT